MEALDANDQPPMFINTTLFAAVEENAVFGTSVTKLEVSGIKDGFVEELKMQKCSYCRTKLREGSTVQQLYCYCPQDEYTKHMLLFLLCMYYPESFHRQPMLTVAMEV